jgi:Pilus formation protein N terminal region
MRYFFHTRRLAGASLAGLIALLLASSAANARGITVPTDEVRVLNFEQPMTTVYVGNPSIADVTVMDASHAFVLGKNFGTTNIVGLDDKGNEVFNMTVTVSGHSGNVVTLQRGTAKMTYACAASRCEPAPLPGDDKEPFESVTSQMDKRVAQARAATSPNGQ